METGNRNLGMKSNSESEKLFKPGARICPIYNEKERVYGHIIYDK